MFDATTWTFNTPLFTFSVAVVCLAYVYVGYPLLLAIVASLRRRPSVNTEYVPSVSVLIAAYNEEATIGRKIHETLALDYPPDKLEIVVVSDGSTDRTDEIVKSLRENRVRLLRVEGRRGKTTAQNEGVAICRGDVIVFSDATSIYHPQSVRLIAACYADDRVGAVSGRYRYFDPGGKSPTGAGSVAFWNLENLIKFFQSRISTLTGCSGCIYSVRRDRYVRLPADACSDLVEPLQIVRAGYRVRFESRAIAYEETTVTTRQEWKMRVRVATRGMRGVLSVRELLNPRIHPWPAFQLISHKVLRWLSPFFLLLVFFSTAMLTEDPFFRVLFAAQAMFYCWALGSLILPVHERFRLLAIPLYFCTLNAAFMAGLVGLIRGEKHTIWQTVRNTR
jgi:cellulose synthase/poly-beta-1,6-N-acetylglucosamine synthase-like glycosyltransferase